MTMVDFRTIDWHTEADRGCARKHPYGRTTARSIAARMQTAGDRTVSAYRCPWADDNDPHWHVGHLPSMEGLERIAAAIRNRNEGDQT